MESTYRVRERREDEFPLYEFIWQMMEDDDE